MTRHPPWATKTTTTTTMMMVTMIINSKRCCYFFFVVGLCAFLPQRSLGDDCSKLGPCSCQSSSGVIDLSPLDGHGTPYYQDYTSQLDSYFYSWNPCSPFTELGAACTDVSGCQVSQDKTTGYPLGSQDSAQFTTDATTGDLYIQYSDKDGRSLSVTLVCDPNDAGTLTVAGEVQPGSYVMSLNSIHCCPGGGPAPGPSGGGGGGGGLSIGSVLVIVFFGVLVVYASMGFTIQKFVRKAEGKEVIPNYTLWAAVPGLVKEGVIFTFTCGKRSGYDKV